MISYRQHQNRCINEVEMAMAEVEKTLDTLDESHESTEKKHQVSGKFRGSDHWLRELNRVNQYGVGANVGSRVVVAAIGGLLASKIGLAEHFDHGNMQHLTPRMEQLIDKSLDKAPVARAVFEGI